MSSLAQAALAGAVRAYRFVLSPWLGNSCRFAPTCSAYALEAIETHGAALGVALTVGRIGRCHPWCAGGVDPVPASRPGFLSALLGRAGPADTVQPAPAETRS